LKRLTSFLIMLLAVVSFSHAGGSGERAEGSKSETPTGLGKIVFTANGEDFVRKGFIDKNGWHISFDKLFVNIVNPTAYIPVEDGREVVLEGSYWTDLAAGGPDAEPIVLGEVHDVPPGNYQSLRFGIGRKESGEYEGYSIVMVGEASGEGRVVPFVIKVDEEMDFDGKEGYVGEELKGLLPPGGGTEVEMTFHFDHLFGDIEAPPDDHINTGSVGFDFFRKFEKNGRVDVSQQEMKRAEGYATLIRAVWTLGHLGEGHCECTNQSSAGEIEG